MAVEQGSVVAMGTANPPRCARTLLTLHISTPLVGNLGALFAGASHSDFDEDEAYAVRILEHVCSVSHEECSSSHRARAMLSLSALLLEGKGAVPKDEPRGLAYLESAAELENPHAQTTYGEVSCRANI